ncbi:hypothetical protein PHMEG_00025997 [Phytophthora megakarya]|uniref:Uncharacterized protein n=1 Tax=Phytophthora megakarya TaxID=4795 RepID=A0A225VD71_9STRA|nr:hypothetical protein PHMEG_00025997 [Phytophthora megakarya]
MTSSDAAFLAEVDRFLTSCDSPLSSVMHMVADYKLNEVIPEPTPRVRINPVPHKGRPVRSKADMLAKREIERAKDRKRRKAYRERRRLERDLLQNQIKELSGKLSSLQKGKEQKFSLSAASWKIIAIRQLEQLQAAELQQQRLQEEVQSRTRLIEEFTGLAYDRLDGDDIPKELLDESHCHHKRVRLGSSDFDIFELDDIPKELLDESHCQHKRVRLGSSDFDIFELYLLELNGVYAEIDHIFKKYQMNSPQQPTWTFEGKTGYFEFADKLEVPFDFKLVSQFLWQLSHILHRQEDRKLYDGVTDPANTVALKYRIRMRLNCGRSVSAVQSIVGRRYNENDRVVVVWRSFTEGEGLFSGMHSDETGWCIVHPSTIAENTGTSVDLCIRHKPMHIDSVERNEHIVEQFAGLVNNSGSEDVATITSSLKNMLSENK